ncbi:hypothetical protein KC887_10005 [Candidatus Kaiserbacteria bacterium]|nr:hypothetical protein [Candidatus Kaiserbacteria bacterium]
MTQHERNVIAASHKAYDEYAKRYAGFPVTKEALQAWHDTWHKEMEPDAAAFDENEEAMFLYGTGRL